MPQTEPTYAWSITDADEEVEEKKRGHTFAASIVGPPVALVVGVAKGSPVLQFGSFRFLGLDPENVQIADKRFLHASTSTAVGPAVATVGSVPETQLCLPRKRSFPRVQTLPVCVLFGKRYGAFNYY